MRTTVWQFSWANALIGMRPRRSAGLGTIRNREAAAFVRFYDEVIAPSTRGTGTMAEQKTKTTAAAKRTEDAGEFTAEERAAMKERAAELKAAKGKGPKAGKVSGERAVLDAIAEMSDADRVIGERIHAIVTATAPELEPKTWYGQPAYAKNGKVVVFFQAASKFKTRYATLGFNEEAQLDEGTMWPTAFAVTALTDQDEARIAALVKRAVG